MSRAIYLTAMGPASGKSVVALGLVELLSHRVGRLGFFRPIVQSLPDADTELIRAHYHLEPDQVGHAFTAKELHRIVSGGLEAGMAEAVAAYKALASNCDIVVIEGTDFTGPSSPLEFEFNARVARHLGAPVIAVVNGHARTVAEVLDAVRVTEESLVANDDVVVALVVNRVPIDELDEVREHLAARPADVPPAWALPEADGLRYPTLAELGRALDATVVAGSETDLNRQVQDVKVAAMSVPNLLDHLSDGTVIIAPGDRPDVLAAAALTRHSTAFPAVAGVVLSGGLLPDQRVRDLINGVGDGVRPLPMLAVDTDSYQTATAASVVEGRITPDNERKIELALGLFERGVDLERLEAAIDVSRSTVVTPVMFQYELLERARASHAHIVLPEGLEPRVLAAAERLVRRDVCRLTLLGEEAAVRAKCAELGLDRDLMDTIEVIDPVTSPLREQLAVHMAELRSHKGMQFEAAYDTLTDVSYFGTMMVQDGLATGMVSGAAHTTAQTIRPALELIRTRPGTSIVSSVFLMLLADRVLVYGDCAINPDPTAEQLADIAISSAETASRFGIEPRIAMLSYSTGASGTGADVDKVRAATERVRRLRPDLRVEGPIQYDAAIDASVGAAKLPGSDVAGRATVFIFPDLNTGNNTYKAVQRSANAVAVGPVLQGLNRPVNDLSRGATVVDIVNTVAITAIQSASDTPDTATPATPAADELAGLVV